MSCRCGQSHAETKVRWTPPRYQTCRRCQGPARLRRRYDEALKRYVDVEFCPVCDTPVAR